MPENFSTASPRRSKKVSHRRALPERKAASLGTCNTFSLSLSFSLFYLCFLEIPCSTMPFLPPFETCPLTPNGCVLRQREYHHSHGSMSYWFKQHIHDITIPRTKCNNSKKVFHPLQKRRVRYLQVKKKTFVEHAPTFSMLLSHNKRMLRACSWSDVSRNFDFDTQRYLQALTKHIYTQKSSNFPFPLSAQCI
jgi:hypothetical protein